jgi:hypothetical protein
LLGGGINREEIPLFLPGGIVIEHVGVKVRAYQKAQKERMGQELCLEKDPGIPKSLYSERRRTI